MLRNRSVPVDAVLPHVTYKDLSRAIKWLTSTFGFVEHYRHGEPPSGAQLHLGNAWLMVHAAKAEQQNPAELGYGTQSLTIFVEDVEGHYTHTRGAGAAIIEELHETIYGELQYGVRDIEGHLWLFSRHVRDVDPTAWGAQMIHPL
jgi:uncharacterized glyoxalase superfamily protein PhnB